MCKKLEEAHYCSDGDKSWTGYANKQLVEWKEKHHEPRKAAKNGMLSSNRTRDAGKGEMVAAVPVL